MAKTVKALVLRAAGTNCDYETVFGFASVGARVSLLHINRLIENKNHLLNYHILAIPGGFTYGDDIASGKILANELKNKLGDKIRRFISDGKLIIGICNGFQVLVKSGFLPALDSNYGRDISATLTINDSAKFEDRWVYLKAVTKKCIWTNTMDDIIYLPVAHGEGKFIIKDESALRQLWENQQVVLQYVDKSGGLSGYPHNPNGSVDNIAGICDNTGRLFGLMPHPERHFQATQHPQWTRLGLKNQGDGAQIFRNAVEYARKNL